MSWDDSATMIALVSVPLIIVASFIVDLAGMNPYRQRADRGTPEHRSELESDPGPWAPATHRNRPGSGRSHRCPYSGVRPDTPDTGVVRVSSRGRVCRQHRG
jgi:hypothetical protein